jgi:hypothetical protein
MTATAPEQVHARATRIAEQRVFVPDERPMYATRPTVWQDEDARIYISLITKRKGENPFYAPMSVDFWESMSLPKGYHSAFGNASAGIVTETVVLRSSDGGATFAELGRCPVEVQSGMFCWASIPGERIIHVMSNDNAAYGPKDNKLVARVSADGGTTWSELAVILQGFQNYPYRLKRLSDDTLICVCQNAEAYGPGRPRRTRGMVRAAVRSEYSTHAWVSTDGGTNWSGPLQIFAGVSAPEPDFVELPDGDLLFVNSTVQGGDQVRQYLRRTRSGFIPGPVLEIASGRAPECLVLTASGLLVGAVRGRDYLCSSDQGVNWHKIHGMPDCRYQPMMTQLTDGRLFCVWYVGGDYRYGQADQWVGAHVFSLEAHLPEPTSLTMNRQLDSSGTQYINTYVATLMAGQKPVSGRRIHYASHRRGTPEYGSGDPMEAGARGTAVTDDDGRVFICLTECDGDTDRHMHYRVRAWFEGDAAASPLLPCRSDVYAAYSLTMSESELQDQSAIA